MIRRTFFLAGALAASSVCHATVVGFGQLGGSNSTVPKNLASRATADGNGFVVTNGATPNIVLTWDANGEQNNGNLGSNGWDIHTSNFFQQIENTTIGGGAWDNEGSTQRVGQLDFGLHTIGFAADPGAQLVLNSLDFGHTGETAGTTMWDLTLTDSVSNVAWSQSVTFTNGMAQTISPNFVGLAGEDYLLTFMRTNSTYGSDGRHAIDNLSFGQIPDLSNSVGSLVINRSGVNAGVASIRADQAFSFSEYEIRSPSGALNPDGWTSITGTNADPTDDWSIVSETAASLHEKDGPTGPNDGVSLGAGAQYNLGQAVNILPTFRRDGTTPTNWEDAAFTIYDAGGTLLAVAPEYVGSPVPWGDYNGDLVVNAQDWPLFRAGFGGNYSGMTASQAYLHGDLDGDFDSDIHDYNVFVALAGGASALLVPEPSSMALIALTGVAIFARRRLRNALVLAIVVAGVSQGSSALAQTLQGFSVVGSTPITSIPAGQLNENENAGPNQLFDDTILDESGQIVFDLFTTNYTDPILFPGGFLGQYAIGGETPGAVDSAFVFMDYGAPVTANWFAYSQRTGGNAVADKVGKFEFWFSNTDFAGVAPTGTPDAIVNLLPGDNRIADSTIRPYTLSGDHTGQYVAMRITETAASGALTSTSRIGGHEFRLLDGPSDVVLTVNRTSGELTLRNNLAGAENILMNGYAIDSPGGALTSAGFNGVGGDGSFPLGNGSGNGWELAGASNPNRLAEAFFTGQSTLTAGSGAISLGNAYNNLSGVEDLAFLWSNTNGEVYNARVEYIGVAPGIAGDYNDDGMVNAADYTVWRDNLDTNVSLPNDSSPGSVTAADYTAWSNNYGKTSPSSAVSVPEPSAVLMLVVAAGVTTRWRRTRRDQAV
ncbi:PEP-CTERM motif protein [Botrimarina colliarenosi]|uniref:PEP-CTERM motif protein n=1 Tax=Botrimarina colliarenosi TaxID=2528001 RepID=A0A5C6AIN3_9BACT|nr:PEP-CTERM sorting domain-containing protein [Botrimarina colliarenosi]TWT99479.1 PEP-CTERM motif protein [Botrimarina colliarenosi]